MGYTHYWYPKRPFTGGEWDAVGEAVTTLLSNLPTRIVLANGLGTPGTHPEMTAKHIELNGQEPDEYETFTMKREPTGDFDFCKTAVRPYDLVVCGILIAMDLIAPGALNISSDGDASDWQPALDWVTRALGDGYAIPACVVDPERER